eukprot:TRINITY_DN11727_c0_g1_i10.p2 TRINITY_DN11727_c0_g1~~TRINITY_DN11727_c0_g1_i10.p2  ORF type:complete len:309 (+),score=12.97 TRINITY_DN11727_c0_g1_i10:3048-3974(+)
MWDDEEDLFMTNISKLAAEIQARRASAALVAAQPAGDIVYQVESPRFQRAEMNRGGALYHDHQNDSLHPRYPAKWIAVYWVYMLLFALAIFSWSWYRLPGRDGYALEYGPFFYLLKRNSRIYSSGFSSDLKGRADELVRFFAVDAHEPGGLHRAPCIFYCNDLNYMQNLLLINLSFCLMLGICLCFARWRNTTQILAVFCLTLVVFFVTILNMKVYGRSHPFEVSMGEETPSHATCVRLNWHESTSWSFGLYFVLHLALLTSPIVTVVVYLSLYRYLSTSLRGCLDEFMWLPCTMCQWYARMCCPCSW